jgi:N-acyl-L-homoserine lactone synthetase
LVHIVSSANRAGFSAQIAEMHRDRKRVFVDGLKWAVPVVDGQYEIDQFDDDGAVYLIELDRRTGKHLASLRLLPSTAPHLLQDVFPNLCDGPVPTGDDVMELTRFCVSPDVRKPDAAVLMNRMWVAAVEYALLFGIARYTCISHMQLLSVMLSSGWEALPLGLPQEIDGQMTGAIIFTITPATLRQGRLRFGYRTPVLDVITAAVAA